MKYRADIDGLRAIAILLVLIYHGGLSLFPSGFIGVDVFFVISGFLITGIIHDSLNTHSFSFIAFYNRRLWRLQPVLVCMIFIATGLTLLFFLPDDLIEFMRSARKTSLFISNIFFNKTTTGYFSPDVHELPLLHTWSLSIEWQCYFILPLVMYGLHKLFKPRYLICVIYLLTILSLVLSLHYSKSLPAQTYYQFSSRFFEFLMGSCIALLPVRPISINKYWVNFVGACAIILIVYIARLKDVVPGYPNAYAFLVCGATGVLVAAGRFFPNELIVRLLSFRPLVFVGVLSYSLYIWHWLVFSMLSYQNMLNNSFTLVLAYLGIFILAWFSWRYIEKPSRRLKRIKFQYTVLFLVILPVLMIHLMDYTFKINSGFPQRFNEELVSVYQQLKQYSTEQRPLCISNTLSDFKTRCTIGSKNIHSKTGLLIGDSFSNHYWGFIDTLASAANIKVLAQGTSSCITLPGIYLYDWWHFKNEVYQECREQTERYYRMIQHNHYDYVFIGQVWSNYLSDSIINKTGDPRSIDLAKARIEAALDNALKRIETSGAQPVLLQSTALMKNNINQCFYEHIKLRQAYSSDHCDFQLHLTEGEQWFVNLFDKMKVKHPGLVIIDPKKVQCPNNQCSAAVNGIPVYRDVGHITDYASYQLGSKYLQKFGNPLA